MDRIKNAHINEITVVKGKVGERRELRERKDNKGMDMLMGWEWGKKQN
jgi:hypothetical protein